MSGSVFPGLDLICFTLGESSQSADKVIFRDIQSLQSFCEWTAFPEVCFILQSCLNSFMPLHRGHHWSPFPPFLASSPQISLPRNSDVLGGFVGSFLSLELRLLWSSDSVGYLMCSLSFQASAPPDCHTLKFLFVVETCQLCPDFDILLLLLKHPEVFTGFMASTLPPPRSPPSWTIRVSFSMRFLLRWWTTSVCLIQCEAAVIHL